MTEKIRLLSLSEVKHLLNKARKNREELNEPQKQTLQHAEKFAKLSLEKTKKLIEDLLKIEGIEESSALKIADLLPTHEEDVKLIFAKARVTLKEDQIKQVLKIVGGYLE
ncbi:MAG TPA: RNA polymerase [Thermoplasmata archaeon]|nr:RNA polymerase [Thermoplasmata archaeon]